MNLWSGIGTALPLKEPNRVIISGGVRTVGAFLRGRKDGRLRTQQIDKSKAFITTHYKGYGYSFTTVTYKARTVGQ